MIESVLIGLLMILVGSGVAYLQVRNLQTARRTGVIQARGWSYNRNERPTLFRITVAFSVLGVGILSMIAFFGVFLLAAPVFGAGQ